MKRQAWLNTFPKPQAQKAVEALTLGWNELALNPKPDFNHGTPEPKLTIVLASYLRDVISVRQKLLGRWGNEDVKAQVDFTTGRIIKQTRTDIEYSWNDTAQNLLIVFEFKKLDHKEQSRKHYYGEKGMMRFVTGTYSLRQPLAFMVAVVVDEKRHCVDALRQSLLKDDIVGLLQMCKQDGNYLLTPSGLFPAYAAFDTEHVREIEKAPAHGTIRMAHMFLNFGYARPSDED